MYTANDLHEFLESAHYGIARRVDELVEVIKDSENMAVNDLRDIIGKIAGVIAKRLERGYSDGQNMLQGVESYEESIEGERDWYESEVESYKEQYEDLKEKAISVCSHISELGIRCDAIGSLAPNGRHYCDVHVAESFDKPIVPLRAVVASTDSAFDW